MSSLIVPYGYCLVVSLVFHSLVSLASSDSKSKSKSKSKKSPGRAALHLLQDLLYKEDEEDLRRRKEKEDLEKRKNSLTESPCTSGEGQEAVKANTAADGDPGGSVSGSGSGSASPPRSVLEGIRVKFGDVRVVDTEHAMYRMTVTSSKSGKTWQVWRRVSEFVALKAAVQKSSAKELPLPPLPYSLTYRKSFDPDYLISRRRKLHRFMDALWETSDFLSNPDLISFLRPDHCSGVDAGEKEKEYPVTEQGLAKSSEQEGNASTTPSALARARGASSNGSGEESESSEDESGYDSGFEAPEKPLQHLDRSASSDSPKLKGVTVTPHKSEGDSSYLRPLSMPAAPTQDRRSPSQQQQQQQQQQKPSMASIAKLSMATKSKAMAFAAGASSKASSMKLPSSLKAAGLSASSTMAAAAASATATATATTTAMRESTNTGAADDQN